MKCPHCDQELPAVPCPACGAGNPESARFCMECGRPLHEQEAPDEADEADEASFDLDDRVLCSDGTCTGIIVDGRCTECGRNWTEAELKGESDV